MKKNYKLAYTSADTEESYYVYETPITKYFEDEYVFVSPFWGSYNRNRYSTYIAKITGRDEKRNEIREYLKETKDGVYVNDWKVGDIIKLNMWDTRRYNHSTDYFLIIEKTDDVIRYARETTYLKAKKLFTLGYSVVEDEDYEEE